MKIPQSVTTLLDKISDTRIYVRRFIRHWLFFKPLYKIQKLIDPNSIFPIAKPKFPKYSQFVYKVAKWSL